MKAIWARPELEVSARDSLVPRKTQPNKRHGVDAGGAFCLYTGHRWPGTTHAER
jgi:hypothetical protein